MMCTTKGRKHILLLVDCHVDVIAGTQAAILNHEVGVNCVLRIVNEMLKVLVPVASDGLCKPYFMWGRVNCLIDCYLEFLSLAPGPGNNISYPVYATALSRQGVESISPPPSIWIDPVTALTHRLWQKWHYLFWGALNWAGRVYFPPLEASCHVSHAGTLQLPCYVKLTPSGEGLETETLCEGRESPWGTHCVREPPWSSCPEDPLGNSRPSCNLVTTT